eukprot:UN00192
MRVLITGAGGQIGYSLIPLVAGGAVCGPDVFIDLVLLDVKQEFMVGVGMEIADSAYPLLSSVSYHTDPKEAFKNVDVALMVGGAARGPGMNRSDLLNMNAKIFVAAGQALEESVKETGKTDVKVLVVANPANTNCYIMQQQCPSVPRENFNALTRLDHNRAVSQIAEKLGLPPRNIKKMAIWGNHSNTMVVDSSHVITADGKKVELDQEYVTKQLIPKVQLRGSEIISARQGKSSALSAANATANHIYNWLYGVPEDDFVSVSLPSNGEYGIAKDIIFSFPCTSSNGKWKVVEGLELNDELRAALKKTEEELLSEKAIYEASQQTAQ